MDITSIINPAIKLICLWYPVNHPITTLLLVAEIIANISKGIPIPIPKTMKLKKFETKLTADVLTANKTTNEAGLHGRTIAPKNNPKMNELE